MVVADLRRMLRLARSCLLVACCVGADALPARASRAHAARRDGADRRSTASSTKPRGRRRRARAASRSGSRRTARRRSQDTQFAVLYDDDAIYVGVWADDPEPAKIRRLLTRRDVDVARRRDRDRHRQLSRPPHRATCSSSTPPACSATCCCSTTSTQDDTWDAVWTGDVAITPQGWTAEFRIPLNQLRFAGARRARVGLPGRAHGRAHAGAERVVAVAAHRPQIVSKFGVVDGIDRTEAGAPPRAACRTRPAASRRMPIDAGDPLNDRARRRAATSASISSTASGPAFTLSATINPDFGQVEADPSQVNLSANELFFAEKRPFFLEGVDLFKLPIGNGDNVIEGAFYSRRIGAAPRRARRGLRLHRRADRDDDLRRREADRQDAQRLVGRRARRGHRRGERDDRRRRPARSRADRRAAHELRGRAASSAICASGKHVDRRVGDRGQPRARRHAARRRCSTIRRTPAGSQLTASLGRQRVGARRRTASAATCTAAEEAIARHAAAQSPPVPAPRRRRTSHFDPTRTSLSGLGADVDGRAARRDQALALRHGGDLRTTGPRAQRRRLPAATRIA